MARSLATALLALLTLTLAGACRWLPAPNGAGAPAPESVTSSGEPFRIGAIFDITGPGSRAGVHARESARLIEQGGEYIGVGGVYRFGPLDHDGLDETSLVVAQIRAGQYHLVSH